MENIYKLNLHEESNDGILKITRVPGGWIYSIFLEEEVNSVFVPFNNEFSHSENNNPTMLVENKHQVN